MRSARPDACSKATSAAAEPAPSVEEPSGGGHLGCDVEAPAERDVEGRDSEKRAGVHDEAP